MNGSGGGNPAGAAVAAPAASAPAPALAPAAPVEVVTAGAHEYGEAAATARHYGAMRFTMFTVFTTISGALMAAPFTAGGTAFALAHPRNLVALCLAGLLTSLMFGLLEWRVSTLLVHYQQRAHDLGVLPLPPGHALWRRIALPTMLLPSVVTGLFWLLLWRGWLLLPALRV